tara:strand:+ start:5691 stop:5999 length:309 start_codon:yes stop_codon:yes gene_type:complete
MAESLTIEMVGENSVTETLAKRVVKAENALLVESQNMRLVLNDYADLQEGYNALKADYEYVIEDRRQHEEHLRKIKRRTRMLAGLAIVTVVASIITTSLKFI